MPGPPKRFAQAIGAALTTAAAILSLGFGADAAAAVLVALLVAASSLEAVFKLCVGCRVFALLIRAGVIPDAVCERCADLPAAPVPPAAPARRAA